MTSRMELLDLIDQALTARLGLDKVSRRHDGVLIVAGSSEAFAIQAITIDAPDFADPFEFGGDLVKFMQSQAEAPAGKPWGFDPGPEKAS